MDARGIDLLLDQVVALADGCFCLAIIDLVDMNEVVIASTLQVHEYTVDVFETIAQDLDALSQADKEACPSDACDMD